MTYEAFCGSGLDLSAVGFMPGGEAYFCTPVGATILGRAGVDGIEDCRIRSLILPLLADHVLREANHFLRLLS